MRNVYACLSRRTRDLPVISSELVGGAHQKLGSSGTTERGRALRLHFRTAYKSLRGSDPDAAVHYLSRILLAGICRRPAAGLCALPVRTWGLLYISDNPPLLSRRWMALQLGMPEARLPLPTPLFILCRPSQIQDILPLRRRKGCGKRKGGTCAPVPSKQAFRRRRRREKGQGYLLSPRL